MDASQQQSASPQPPASRGAPDVTAAGALPTSSAGEPRGPPGSSDSRPSSSSTGAAASASSQTTGKGVVASDYAAGDDDDDADAAEPANLDELMAALERRLALGDDSGKELLSRLKREPLLPSLDLPGVAALIASGKARRVIVMCGAGVSVSAGIPDFRTPGTGLYSQLERYGLPEPEAVFSIGYFRKNPKPFHLLAKELFPGNYKPTPAHLFMKLLHDKGLLLRCFTQNIDSLERQAGLPASAVVAAHGNFDSAHCIKCGREHSLEHVKEAVFSDAICHCTKCNAFVKPDIVFFGEQLPDRFYERMEYDFPTCDLLLVMGTSLVVHPFASLIDAVPDHCPRVLINHERVGEGMGSMGLLGGLMGFGGGGFVFEGSEGAYRDVLYLGDADDGVRQLADLLGWREELEALIDACPGGSKAGGSSSGSGSDSNRGEDGGSSSGEGGSGEPAAAAVAAQPGAGTSSGRPGAASPAAAAATGGGSVAGAPDGDGGSGSGAAAGPAASSQADAGDEGTGPAARSKV